MIELFNEDCLVTMDRLQDKSIDFTITSPPYDYLRTYNRNTDSWGQHVWEEVIRELYRITKPGGVVVLGGFGRNKQRQRNRYKF